MQNRLKKLTTPYYNQKNININYKLYKIKKMTKNNCNLTLKIIPKKSNAMISHAKQVHNNNKCIKHKSKSKNNKDK